MKLNCHYCGNENHESDIFCGLCRRRTVIDVSGKHTPASILNGRIPITFQPDTLFNGETQVKVFRKDLDEQTGRERVRQIHEGIVVQQTSHFARVYNPMAPESGGDISMDMTQMFPIKSPRCWVEIIGQQESPLKISAAVK